MIITRKYLPRRTILRGIGATVALPLLDAMVPAFSSPRAAGLLPARFCALYVGNGMNMSQWTPTTEGALTLSPILQPLAPFRDRVLVLTGFDNREGGSDDAGGLHSRIQPAWLTGTQAKRTEGADVEVGVSMDQIAAAALGSETPLSSLELALESVDVTRACEPAYSCTYVSTLAWRNSVTPLPMEVNPRAVFERLFGDGSGVEARARQREKDRSILDRLTRDIAALQGRLGADDRREVEEFVEAIRGVERRIQKAEARPEAELPPGLDIARFIGIPETFEAHAKLMFELLALAFQSDRVRVSTVLMVRERSDRVFPESGVLEPIHPLSHHFEDPDRLEQQARLNTFHVRMFADLVGRLASIPALDGSLLDHTILLFGSGMSNSNLHLPLDVPTVVAGGAGVGLRGGRHVRYAPGTPLANLQVSLLARLGVAVERFGDSSGRVGMLSDI
ncbi:MAG: DUF1552 domain-containing protein [Acidimicrobiia bacterium]|nr:DUF1552 domain-containing protein [Acidimicrobiia bacterium]